MREFISVLSLLILVSCQTDSPNVEDLDDALRKANDESEEYTIRLSSNDKAIQIINEKPNDSLKTEYMYKIANRYWNMYEFDKFKEITNLTLQLSKDIKSEVLEAKGYYYIGDYYTTVFDKKRDSAHYYYTRSLNLYKKNLCYKEQRRVSLKIAKNLFEVGDLSKSELYAFKSIKNIDSSQEFVNEFEGELLLGCISVQLNENGEAISYMEKAVRIAEANVLDDVYMAIAYNNIGRAYLNVKQYDKALAYFEKGLEYTTLKHDDIALYAMLIENLMITSYKMKSAKYPIETLFLKSLKIKDSLNYDRVNGRIHLSQYYQSIDDKPKALLYARQAIDISKKEKKPYDQISAMKNLIFLDQNAEVKKSFIELCDSINLVERKNKNQFSRIEFENNEVLSQKDTAVKEKRVITIIASGLTIILILSLGIKNQKVRRKHAELTTIRQAHNEEMYKIMIQQHEKVEEVRQNEKRRIARDLHDGVVNRLASIRFNLFVLEKKPDERTMEKRFLYINQIQDIEKEIRVISQNLDVIGGDESEGFENIIKTFIAEQNLFSQVEFLIKFDAMINWQIFSSEKKMHIYRIVQEAIQNASRHSFSTKISIAFADKEKYVLLVIEDDGRGFDYKRAVKGMGIKNIHYRVNQINSKISINSDDDGTQIKIQIPKTL